MKQITKLMLAMLLVLSIVSCKKEELKGKDGKSDAGGITEMQGKWEEGGMFRLDIPKERNGIRYFDSIWIEDYFDIEITYNRTSENYTVESISPVPFTYPIKLQFYESEYNGYVQKNHIILGAFEFSLYLNNEYYKLKPQLGERGIYNGVQYQNIVGFIEKGTDYDNDFDIWLTYDIYDTNNKKIGTFEVSLYMVPGLTNLK